MPVMMFVGNLNYVVIAVVGGLRVASGTMSLGDVQAFIQYSRQFTQPLTQVASMANVLQSGVASAERVFEVLDAAEQEPDAADAGRASSDPHGPRRLRGRVVLLHARQAAHRGPRPVGASPGQTVAIVGPTGAGKTTLVNLIMRFYELDSGRITLDGVDIRDLTRHDLRSRIGMVLQDTWLFGGTIRDNIAYGASGRHRGGGPRGGPGDLRRPLRALAARRLRHGARRRGRPTSRRARSSCVTIARAFLADPALLILDEATSSVDTRTELLVQHAMAALRSPTGPASSSRTACRRSATPTSSSSWRTGTSSSRARTPSCSPATAPTRRCMPRSSRVPRPTSTRRLRRSPDPARAAA